jgi:hypothetical protein
LNGVLDEWCERVGRNPNEIERSVQILDSQIDKLDAYLEAGMTHIIGETGGPDYDLSGLEKMIEWRDRNQSPSS